MLIPNGSVVQPVANGFGHLEKTSGEAVIEEGVVGDGTNCGDPNKSWPKAKKQ